MHSRRIHHKVFKLGISHCSTYNISTLIHLYCSIFYVAILPLQEHNAFLGVVWSAVIAPCTHTHSTHWCTDWYWFDCTVFDTVWSIMWSITHFVDISFNSLSSWCQCWYNEPSVQNSSSIIQKAHLQVLHVALWKFVE